MQCERTRTRGDTTPAGSCSSAEMMDTDPRDTPQGARTGSSVMSAGTVSPHPLVSGMCDFSKKHTALEQRLTTAQLAAVTAKVERLARTSPSTLAACLVEVLQGEVKTRPVVAKHLGLSDTLQNIDPRLPSLGTAAAAPATRVLPSSSYYPMPAAEGVPLGVPLITNTGGSRATPDWASKAAMMPPLTEQIPLPLSQGVGGGGGVGLGSMSMSMGGTVLGTPMGTPVKSAEKETATMASKIASQVLDC